MKAKRVIESIDFERGLDPKIAMGIGQKVAIEKWFEDIFEGYPPEWRLNEDGTIDLFENFESPDKKIRIFPDFIQFNECHGDFMIDCCEMESLRGCPKEVIGYFSCEQNNLMTLDGMPEMVFGDIFVRDNPGHFKEIDVLEKTANLSQRKIYSEDSHVDEGIEFTREGDPLDKMKAGRKHFYELHTIGYPTQERILTDEEVEDVLKNWINRSSADFRYNTDKGAVAVEELDGKLVKFNGEYYQLPEYVDNFTSDATVGYSIPQKPAPQGWDELEENIGIGMKAKKVYEFVNFTRAGADASPAEVLKNAGIGRSQVTITWGKHRGKTVGDVFNEDPQYIVWLASSGSPRRGQEGVFEEIHRLADVYLKQQEEKKAEEGFGSPYGKIGDIFEGPIEIKRAKYYSGEYGSAYQIIAKYPPGSSQAKHWIMFYSNFNNLTKLFNLKDPDTISTEIRDRMRDIAGKIIDIRGKVKSHSEYKGLQYTGLNFVKFLGTLTESLDFERGKDPKSALGIGTIEVLKSELAELAVKYDLPVIDDRSERNGYIWWYDAAGNVIKLHWNKKDRVPILMIENTEEGSEKIIGFDNIRDYIQSGELDEFFFYEG